MIFLPVIEALSVKNYPLYPGKNNQGLELEFSDGVTVFAGINGVGKTTLLNLLLRMLVGPSSPKVTNDISRVSKRDLYSKKNFDYFVSRIPAGISDNSTAKLIFTLNKYKIEITRTLVSMQLKTVVIDGKKKKFESELELMNRLAELSGLATGYDFHMVVRYLQFFTEERLPILWSAGTQFEFLKMLFLDRNLARKLSASFAEVQKHDSNYRNAVHQQKVQKENAPSQLQPSNIELGSLDGLIKEAVGLHEEINKKYQKQYAIFQDLQRKSFEFEHALEEADVNLASRETELSQDDALFIAQSFPNIEDKLKLLMHGIGSRSGCFICNNSGKKELAEIGRKIRQGHCFVCSASINKGVKSKVVPITALKVRSLEEQVTKLKQEIIDTTKQRDENVISCSEAASVLRGIATERLLAGQRLDSLRAQRPTEHVAATPENDLDREEASIKDLESLRKKHSDEYRQLIDHAQEQIETVKEKIRTAVAKYAQAFLYEKVEVVFRKETVLKLATGVPNIKVPTFYVEMTSSTHQIPSKRDKIDSVSESQKEFLDLAFRMAILELISDSQRTMVVIETPEASLDSWFMLRAAELMRKFADGTEHSNKILVTSNLNRTVMIPALLGLINKHGKVVRKLPKDDPHLVNMMDVTARASVLNESIAHDMLDAEIRSYTHG